MKYYIILFLLLFTHPFDSFSQLKFFWLDENRKLHNEINLSTGEYIEEVTPRKYIVQGKIQFDSSIRYTLPVQTFGTYGFYRKGIFYLAINGTGQIYRWDKKKLELRRIDKTSYAGYNFGSLKFIRKDTLFSFGGYGFWHQNGVATYFDFVTNEWEELKTSNEGPKEIMNNSSGYDAKTDGIWVIELKNNFNFNLSEEIPVYFFSFGNKTWSKKGYLNQKAINELGIDPKRIFNIGHLFLFNIGSKALLVDAQKNQLYQLTGEVKNAIILRTHLYHSSDTIVVYEPLDFKKENNIIYKKIPVNQLIQSGSPLIESFYYSGRFWTKFTQLEIVLFSLMFFLIILFIRLYFKKQKKAFVTREFNETEIAVLHAFAENPKQILTTQELNELIGCEKKTVESQKQIRFRFIVDINTLFKAKFNIDDAINRSTSETDKRFILYSMSEEAINIIKKGI